MLVGNLDLKGRAINFPREHALHGMLVGMCCKFDGTPREALMILASMPLPGWPRRSCQMTCVDLVLPTLCKHSIRVI